MADEALEVEEVEPALEGQMPIGNRIALPIRKEDVEITEGNAEPARFTDDAAATLVWQNYQQARNYIENHSWLLEWQHTDILYQSPTLDRFPRVHNDRPPRISRFLVAKNTNTMARKVKRAIFAQQNPFFLRPKGKTTERMVDAWTAIVAILLKRMNFKYHGSLVIDCQTLQGTGIGKMGYDTKTVIREHRRRKSPSPTIDLPIGGQKEIPSDESDEFEVEPKKVEETWPYFEYRKLGTTLFDPKWCTPNRPDLSGTYSIDIEYVNFEDLQEMRKSTCYKNIPDDETLKNYFLNLPVQSAPQGSQIEDNFSAQGSSVTHAEGRNRQTSENPFDKPLMLIEEWTCRTVRALLCYEGQYLIIRNEEHKMPRDPHVTANWWSIDANGYGMGVGRLDGPDQRINQGVLNEALKMLAYPMNAPIVYLRGENAPTQNVIQRHGGFWAVDPPPGVNDVNRAVGFLPMPPIPGDAWKMIQYSLQNSEDLVGANSTFAQGNLGGPGSSAARTATGAARISAMSDENITDPVDNFADGVIVPVVEFCIWIVKEIMPLWEIREILSDSDAKIVLDLIEEEEFMNSEFDIDVLAGQRLQAKQGIQQLIPIYMQILQQPQIMEYLHQIGKTADLAVILDLMMQVSELEGEEDVIRDMTPQEMKNFQNFSPNIQRTQSALAVQQAKNQGKIQEVHAKSQDDLANRAAEIAMEHTAEGIPFTRASGLVERAQDEAFLKGQIPT